MMKRIMFFASLLMAIALFTACQTEDSADVNQDKIYTVYELFYNANTDKTVVIARFRFGTPTGTLLQVNDPASIRFEGDPLPYSILYSGHAKEFAGIVESGTFEYTNVDGKVFTNAVPSLTTFDFPTDLDTIVKSKANSIAWQGDPLAADEQAHVFIGSWKWGEDALGIVTGEGTSEIVLGTDALKSLALGNSTVYMDRIHELEVSEGTSEGGLIRTRYRPVNQDVIVVE